MKKLLISVLVVVLCFAMVLPMASCKDKGPKVEEFDPNATYTYKDSVSTLATNWNPHTYQTSDDAYPADFLRVGFYTFVFNDDIHPVEGKEAFAGYKIIPEMAADMPVDVTTKVKAEHPEFNIPESAEVGYAYTIDLNQNATWENGEKIDADTYVYSMQQLLNPKLLNYRATDYYAQDFSIAGAEFYANQGQTKNVALGVAMANEGIATLDEFLEKHGNDVAYINYTNSFGFAYDFGDAWDGKYDPAKRIADEVGAVQATKLTLSQMREFYLDVVDTARNPDGGWADTATAEAWILEEVFCDWTYPANVDFSTVGLYKSGDYQITLVLSKSLTGFYLLYNLAGNWIVNKTLYEANLTEKDGAWTSTYNTSVETTLSYGPYKMTEYKADSHMKFERNTAWYGYNDGQHIYVDPTDGKTYLMYQTTAIECRKVEEAATRKMMFLNGELMGYGLQSEDFDEYRSSEWVHATPSETIFFLIFNGYKAKLDEREAAEDFDTSKYDLQTMSLKTFRQAVAVTYDKEAFASTVSPSRSGGYGLIGNAYLYDPETGARYRDTDQAKKALCDFYSVDISKYNNDLDKAVKSITGYDPVAAKELFGKAFDEAIAAGYITDADGDGKSDQIVTIEYCASAQSAFMEKTVAYLNEKMQEVVAGTPFDGKIQFTLSAPYGSEWSTKIKSGLSDTVLGGWSGSAFNPFSLTDLYVNPNYQYDAQWFNAANVEMELTVKVDGADKTIKTNIKNWSDALNGATIEIEGVEYNFGDGIADVDTRLNILAALESTILQTYDYIPTLQDASMALLSKQVYYVVEEYNPVMGRGGIAYMKYNYSDAEWTEYVKSEGGTLKY